MMKYDGQVGGGGRGSFRVKVRNLQFVLLVDKLRRFNRKYDQSHVTSRTL